MAAPVRTDLMMSGRLQLEGGRKSAEPGSEGVAFHDVLNDARSVPVQPRAERAERAAAPRTAAADGPWRGGRAEKPRSPRARSEEESNEPEAAGGVEESQRKLNDAATPAAAGAADEAEAAGEQVDPVAEGSPDAGGGRTDTPDAAEAAAAGAMAGQTRVGPAMGDVQAQAADVDTAGADPQATIEAATKVGANANEHVHAATTNAAAGPEAPADGQPAPSANPDTRVPPAPADPAAAEQVAPPATGPQAMQSGGGRRRASETSAVSHAAQAERLVDDRPQPDDAGGQSPQDDPGDAPYGARPSVQGKFGTPDAAAGAAAAGNAATTRPDAAASPVDTGALDALGSATTIKPAGSQAAPTAGQSSNASAPHTPREMEFTSANHDRIITTIRSQLLPKGGAMQIRLDPPNLGTLEVAVRLIDGVMSVSFQTSNEETTRLLSHSLSHLKHALEVQGVNVDKLHVQQAARNEPSDRQSADQQQQQQDFRDGSFARQEQQRKEMLRRMWRRLAMGNDPLDLVA